jgi:threonine dehydrogenase-like Zn-dependent dehydrogenase
MNSAAKFSTTARPRRAKLKAGTRVCSLPALLTSDGPQGIGYSNDNIGGYAERILLSEALLLEVPNGLAAEHAALTEPLAVGIHAVAGVAAGAEAGVDFRMRRDTRPAAAGVRRRAA